MCSHSLMLCRRQAKILLKMISNFKKQMTKAYDYVFLKYGNNRNRMSLL